MNDDSPSEKSLAIVDRVAERTRELDELTEKARRLRERGRNLRDEPEAPKQ
jgi:hypothetical protein